MKPILYEPTATDFSNNGIGVLSDAVFCEVTEERNGILELVLDYPINGLHFSEIKQRSIITAKPNPTADAQPFRVYRVTKPLNGTVTVFAQHISYDLSGIAVTPFSAGSAAAALQALKNNSVVENPFEFWTDKSTVAEMNVKMPASVRAMLGGVEGSVLDTYGGEYEWDGYTVKLYNERGKNRGVSIRYGKNLVDLEQEENCANVYTAVMPFWADSEGNSTMLEEKIVEVEGNFDFVRVLTLDLSGEFEEQPTQEQLRSRAQSYIKINKIGVPKISLKVSFVPLEQTEEYKNIALLERVNLCDTVNVEFEKLGVSATAKVIKTVYNVLLNRYESVELGDAKSNLADTIVQQEQAIKEAPKKAMSMVAQAAENATQLITGNRGGYVVIHSSTGQSRPDEILILDKPTIDIAVKVWRWNNSGLGYSENGYPGPYISAWTIDGAFNADFITAGTISANLIRSGLLQNLDTRNAKTLLDMDSGKMIFEFPNISAGYIRKIEIWAGGITFYRTDSTTLETKHLGSFYVSGDGVGVIKCDKLYISKNDQNTYVNLGRNQNENGYVEVLNRDGKVVAEAVVDIKTANGSISVNDADGKNKAYLFVDENNSGCLYLLNGEEKAVAILNNSEGSGGRFVLNNEDENVVVQLRNKTGNGGELSLLDYNSNSVAILKATDSGASLSLGNAEDGVWTLAEYDYEGRHLHADHFHFHNKNDGLITSRKSASQCSAYIVAMKPTSSGGYVSIIIPSDKADGSTLWQIADDGKFCNFTINSSGNISYVNGTNITSSALVYSIR